MQLQQQQQQPQSFFSCGRFIYNTIFVAALIGILLLTYNRCIECVVAISIVSLITINCIPFMPIVFLLSVAVILLHAVDYNQATIKVNIF